VSSLEPIICKQESLVIGIVHQEEAKLYEVLMQSCGGSRRTLTVRILYYRFVLQIEHKQAKRSLIPFLYRYLAKAAATLPHNANSLIIILNGYLVELIPCFL